MVVWSRDAPADRSDCMCLQCQLDYRRRDFTSPQSLISQSTLIPWNPFSCAKASVAVSIVVARWTLQCATCYFHLMHKTGEKKKALYWIINPTDLFWTGPEPYLEMRISCNYTAMHLKVNILLATCLPVMMKEC